ncbi:RNA polymerase recycling motor HelD [Clostridium tepidiprofundi]|uniref:RNA polymerase recycling motor HelD n=1 Tax=Clostridium tepidiprofundi TaxID=420412 RepID=UPI00191C3A17|nr:RNA polymerase recycling motor HelD [Clostridium tepidiprofundi]
MFLSINKKEMDYEKYNLEDTKSWIRKQIEIRDEKYKYIEQKVSSLKKGSRGTYNQELQLALTRQEFELKNLNKFRESEKSPYFARIDFKEKRRECEALYIGKFGLGDEDTFDEKVVDWRAPVADLYYSGTQGKVFYEAPNGTVEGELLLKRKFLIKNGEIKDAFDEGINEVIVKSGILEEGNELVDEFLKITLEESISSKLKDVVATIQKEQNDIIRATMNKPIIVQGSAGSGKTTIALHRLAYLLYRYKNFLSGEDILVIAPNKLFLDYISEVLPNLGADEVKQITFDDMCRKILKFKQKIYSKDVKLSEILENNLDENDMSVKCSKLKGSMFFKTVIDRYVKYIEFYDSKVEDLMYDEFVLFSSKEIKRLYLRDMNHLPINKRKEEIKRYFKGKIKNKLSDVMEQIDNFYDRKVSEIKNNMEDGSERRKILISLYDERDSKKENLKKNAKKRIDIYFKDWLLKDTISLYYDIFKDKDVFDKLTDGSISDSLYEFLVYEINKNKENGIVDSDDLVAMTYLKFKIDGIDDKMKYKHIVIDEAQDYSIFQFQLINLISQNNSMTIVGDLGQGIYTYKGLSDWNQLDKFVYGGNSYYVPLTQSYRSTVEIIDFANNILKKQRNYIKPALPVLRHGKEINIIEYENDIEFSKELNNIIKEVESEGKNSVAVIGKTYNECKKIYDILKKHSNVKWYLVKDNDNTIKMDKIIIPSYLTKGLEFDCSVIFNCNDENYADNELDKKLLYVALTRALHLEYVFYKGKKSKLLD